MLIKFGLRFVWATSAVEQRPTGNLALFLDEKFENGLTFAKFLLVVGATVEKSRFSVAVSPFRSLNSDSHFSMDTAVEKIDLRDSKRT